MKLSLFFLLPAATVAFAPNRFPGALPARSSVITRANEVDEACSTVNGKVDDVLEKTDELLTSRVMRFVDHAPIIVTLKALAEKAGSAKYGVDMAPSVFAGLGTAVAVPTWTFNVWSMIAIAQIASVAKSALADDGNDLSQGDITTTALANVMATRAIASANPLRDTALTALVSGYALRKNSDQDLTIHTAALQLMSSFTTVLTVLGGVSALAARMAILDGRKEIVSTLGVMAYYVMATRNGNGLVKKAVNAGVIGGALYARLAGGISLTTSSLLSVSLVGTAYVAYEAVNRLRKAVSDA